MNAHELSDPDADALTITTRGAKTWITSTSGGEEVTVGPFATDAITGALPADPMDGGVTAALIEQDVEREAQPTAAPSVGLLESALKAALDSEKNAREDAKFWMARWKEAADQRDARDADAHLWKEATREHIGRARTVSSYADVARGAHAEVLTRAETAECERDEAREALFCLRRALDLPENADADAMVARIEEINGAGRTVTDAMVERARQRGSELVGALWDPEVVAAMITAALTPEPQRPEWEQEGAKALTTAVWGVDLPNEAGETGDLLAARLASIGYKVAPVSIEDGAA